MKLLPQTPQKAVKEFLKQKPLRTEIDIFKNNLTALLDSIAIIDKHAKDESEEHLKNNLRDFLKNTYYKDTNAINTKDKKDLVIHLGKTTDSEAAVIIETKRPSNKNEMISADNPNKKAMHELVLYYLDERHNGNNQLKQLVATNILQWFIIDANYFDKHIFRNTQINTIYKTKLNDKKDNPWFYEEIAKIIDSLNIEIPCTYFDIREFETVLRNTKQEDDRKLIPLFKVLTPQHLLKIATPNDSNSLNEQFYKELLHIIGLEEIKEGSKCIIRRKEKNRYEATLIELTIDAITTEDIFHRVSDLKTYGKNREEQTFNIALELCITWINRILFLKLLEGQLITYHQKNKEYRFLNTDMIHDFDELFKLFHKVLAIHISDRVEAIHAKYSRVPYLNSSLFEISTLEDQAIKINSLDNDLQLKLINTSVLKNIHKKTDKLPTLNYLFNFLDAYDFASEGTEDVQEENKTIINASVLGKVFEKINGYKDGSVYTPAFITMYMCRQSVRLAVVQKFNEVLSPKDNKMFETFEDVRNYITRTFKTIEIQKANEIINSLRICDPAVGSGHFLVSALNEIIAIKAELGILADENYVVLNGYDIEIVNDELVITDSKGSIVQYKVENGKTVNKEMQRLQKTLFHEKLKIIENCLFGVDINPKSVLICRLRLWIELLKNAYYKEPEFSELETLPNIDINIKCGNTLLSRFPLDADLSKALKSIKYDIKAYRSFVNDYKKEKNREVKRGLHQIIDKIKADFRTEIFKNDPKVKKLQKLQYEFNILAAPTIFNETQVNDDAEMYGSRENVKKAKLRLKNLEDEINTLSKEIQVIKTNILFKNAFEWRFEFPEVLNNKGEFIGFDLIIGNPPYIKEYENRDAFNGLHSLECYQGKMDIWYLFGDLGLKLLRPDSYLCFIATNNWITNAGASKFRNIIVANSKIVNLYDFGAYMIFENAAIQTMVMIFKKDTESDKYTFEYKKLEGDKLILDDVLNLLYRKKSEKTLLLYPKIIRECFVNKPFTFNTDEHILLLEKIKAKQNFTLFDKADKKNKIKAELANGIHHHHDIVNKDRKSQLNNTYDIGTGIFVINNSELSNLNLSKREFQLIKPHYSSKQIQKYYTNPNNEHWVIYTKSNIGKVDKKTNKIPINNFPKIKAHLDKFKTVITSDFGPYGLHRAREEHFFEGQKIAVLRKCSHQPIFSFSDFDCYLPAAFYVIQSDRINLKFLTGLLNSKLIAFWLKKKGKMQGNNYQLDKEPLLQIPIYKPDEKEQNRIAILVDKIITLKQHGKDTEDIENKIDLLVYQLYNLTEKECDIIENTFSK
jgi:adenine-specific DNA-methyltransferase